MSELLDHRFYYLHNFERALSWLEERYGPLLSTDEQSFILQFRLLAWQPRALLVRLIMRRGPLFRESRVCYPEIDDVPAALIALADLHWIDLDPYVTAEQLAALIPKAVLAEHSNLSRCSSKADLCAELAAAHPHARPASEWSMLAGERLIEVKIAELCVHLKLLFFGNFHQDWKEFVLSDLGIFRYEPIELTSAARAFESRTQIEAFYALHAARLAFEEGEPLDAVQARLPALPLQHEWLEERRAKLQFAIAHEHERSGELLLAFDLYRRCCYPGARARAVRVLEKQARDREALDLIEAYLAQPLSESERELLGRAARRLSRAKNALHRTRQSVQTFELRLHEWDRVEEGVLECLHSSAAPVFYVENLLINGLFGLWCWDAVFAPIAGAFFHPFQRGPADLYSPYFSKRRAGFFARAFDLLERGEHAEVVRERFRSKHGTHNPFVFWGGLSEELLELALQCIPPLHLRCMFERMLADLEHHTSGFPDLVQFYPTERRYRFIEVKGPGDRLQDHQRRWMKFFAQHDIPAQVCRVERGQVAA